MGKGIVILAMVLLSFALFFDIPSAAIAGVGLIIFLITRAFLFLSALSSTARSLTTQRSFLTLIARQGFPIIVETNIKVIVPSGFTAEISDLLPRGAVLSSGTSTASLNKSQSYMLNYTFIQNIVGAHAFEGVQLCLSDDFFSGQMVIRNLSTTLPSLLILPSLKYPNPIESSYREKESSIVPPLIGPEVRSFREAFPGDDFRKIDWKISARYNALFVREYVGRMEQGPLLIIDLPDAQHPYNQEAFNHLKEAAVSMVAMQSHSRKGLSFLLICGPNLLSFTPLESDIRRLIDMIIKFNPSPRLYTMYRYSNTSSLKRRFSSLSGSVDLFSKNLIRISDAFLAHRPPNIFESQINWILNSISARTAHIFTLDIQDTSHIRLISNLAAARGMDIQFHTPREFHIPRDDTRKASNTLFKQNFGPLMEEV